MQVIAEAQQQLRTQLDVKEMLRPLRAYRNYERRNLATDDLCGPELTLDGRRGTWLMKLERRSDAIRCSLLYAIEMRRNHKIRDNVSNMVQFA